MKIREIILDTETTGLEPKEGHRIIEIGALEMVNKVLTGNKFHYYLNPERDVPFDAYRIHGISSDFLKNKPLFKDVAQEFREFIQDSKLIIHNAAFDMNFLNHELLLASLPSLDNSIAVCTWLMSKKQFPGMKCSLDALCKRFNVDNTSRQLHGALKDAALLAEVYVELTGGRQVTFNLDQEKQNNHQQAQILNNITFKTIVIRPTKEELARHKAFIDKINAS